MKKIFLLFLSIVIFLSSIISVRAFDTQNDEFKVILRPSPEPHLWDGTIQYIYMGINSGPLSWGTTKFEMSVDGGKTWFYAYCMNSDLMDNEDLLNRDLDDFDKAYNYENLKKILYYGFNKGTWDSEGYEYVRKHSWYIWMPIYNDGEVVDWQENWTEDLAYCLTHIALSYAYYKDVLGLSEEKASQRAFYGVYESEDFYGTKAVSVAKLWYEYLISKPAVGITVRAAQKGIINAESSGLDNPKKLAFNEEVAIDGAKVNEEVGGRIEFYVPDGMICIVTGEEESDITTSPGEYPAGTKIVLGSGQKFSLSLQEVTDEDLLPIELYENYNVLRVVGGASDEVQYQDIGGMYKTNRAQKAALAIDGNAGKLNITKKIVDKRKSSDKGPIGVKNYYVSVFKDDNTLYKTFTFEVGDSDEISKTLYFPVKEGETSKYYIKETDASGRVLRSNESINIEIDNEEITFSPDNMETSITVTNTIFKSNPNTGAHVPGYIWIGLISGLFVLIITKKNNKMIRI